MEGEAVHFHVRRRCPRRLRACPTGAAGLRPGRSTWSSPPATSTKAAGVISNRSPTCKRRRVQPPGPRSPPPRPWAPKRKPRRRSPMSPATSCTKSTDLRKRPPVSSVAGDRPDPGEVLARGRRRDHDDRPGLGVGFLDCGCHRLCRVGCEVAAVRHPRQSCRRQLDAQPVDLPGERRNRLAIQVLEEGRCGADAVEQG